MASVLVVEDDDTLRASLVQVVELEGWRVHSAEHGADALALLRAGLRPSVILLDVMMPVMDGLTFLVHLRKDPAFDAIPVVLLTATRVDPSVLAGARITLLKKPVVLEALLEVLAVHMV